ncbi:MAG: hypothetical protein Ct9H300mP28_07170 [Pseudomonadota bacterium]|nr:MAG: hypothetical protein Ct9H300mP28_07170 [Pseudomonadota bacterium]
MLVLQLKQGLYWMLKCVLQNLWRHTSEMVMRRLPHWMLVKPSGFYPEDFTLKPCEVDLELSEGDIFR